MSRRPTFEEEVAWEEERLAERQAKQDRFDDLVQVIKTHLEDHTIEETMARIIFNLQPDFDPNDWWNY